MLCINSDFILFHKQNDYVVLNQFNDYVVNLSPSLTHFNTNYLSCLSMHEISALLFIKLIYVYVQSTT